MSSLPIIRFVHAALPLLPPPRQDANPTFPTTPSYKHKRLSSVVVTTSQRLAIKVYPQKAGDLGAISMPSKGGINDTRGSTMRTFAAAIIVACISLFVRLRLSHLNLSPQSFKLPDLPHFVPDNRLANVPIRILGNNDLVGPECLAITPNGKSMFASLGDGRIVRLSDIHSSSSPTWTTVMRTGPGINTKSCSGTAITKPHACFARCGAGGPGDDHATFGPSEYICGRPLGLWLSTRTKDDAGVGRNRS